MTESPIGLLAGAGQFPILLAREARTKGRRVVAVAFEGETDPALGDEVDEIHWMPLGKLGRLLKVLGKAGVTQAVMCGAIRKTRMFTDIKPDARALGLAMHLKTLADDGLLRAFADYLGAKGVEILGAHEIMPSLLADHGVYTKRRPTAEETADAELGWRMAAETGRLDIGQCVAVANRMVVAVEAIEGTDAMIRRAGELAGPGAVIVKRVKPNQDHRFDLPTVGLTTIEVMARAGASCLVLEAGRTLVFDRLAMVEAAERAGICVAAFSGSGPEK